MSSVQAAAEGANDGRPSTAQARFLLAGALSGSVLGLFDLALAVSARADALTCAALLALCASAGVVLLLLAHGASALSALVHAHLPQLPRAGIEALLAALMSIPLAQQLFSGAGVRHSLLGAWGPWGFPLLVAASVATAAWLVRRTLRGGTLARAALAATSAGLAVCALRLDRSWLLGIYDYLHVLLVLFALACLALAFFALRVRAAKRVAVIATSASVLALAALAATFPHDAAARAFLVERRPTAERVIVALQWLVDLDRDGSSALFAGGDCNDLDARVGASQLEIPDNRIDEDCDGKDAPKAPARRDYGGSREAATRVRALARGRPTVVVMIDALRDDRVGRAELPHLRELASESVRFTNAYAPASSTGLAVPAIVVGHNWPWPHDQSAFDRLRAAGASTAFVGADIVAGTITGDAKVKTSTRYPMLRAVDRKELIPTGHGDDSVWGGGVTRATDHEVSAASFALLDGPSPPDLLWVHYYDLHQWDMLSAVNGEGFARYDAALQRVDAEVGAWLERAERINLVVLSDHGEGLGERGTVYHTRYLWSALVRVPLLLRVPGLAAGRVDTPVSTLDLAPTLLDLAGATRPDEALYSLLTLIGVPDPGRSQFIELETRHSALLDGHHRLLIDHRVRAVWLYDVLADPTEAHNLVNLEPARTKRMVEMLLSMRAAVLPPPSVAERLTR